MRISWKSSFFSVNSKSETLMYSRLITHRVKYLKPWLNLDDYGFQLKIPIPQNITILHKTNQKRIYYTEMSTIWKVCSFILSILCWGSFCTITTIASMQLPVFFGSVSRSWKRKSASPIWTVVTGLLSILLYYWLIASMSLCIHAVIHAKACIEYINKHTLQKVQYL